MRDHGRIAKCDRATGREIDLTPQTHILVGWSWIPIDEGNGQIDIGWSEYLHGNGILSTWTDKFGDIELVGSPGAGDVIQICQLLAVDPDIGAVVDAAKIEPDC